MPCVVEANTFIVGANAFECVGRCVLCDHGVKSRKLSMKLARKMKTLHETRAKNKSRKLSMKLARKMAEMDFSDG